MCLLLSDSCLPKPILIECIYEEPVVLVIPSHAAIGGRHGTLTSGAIAWVGRWLERRRSAEIRRGKHYYCILYVRLPLPNCSRTLQMRFAIAVATFYLVSVATIHTHQGTHTEISLGSVESSTGCRPIYQYLLLTTLAVSTDQ